MKLDPSVEATGPGTPVAAVPVETAEPSRGAIRGAATAVRDYSSVVGARGASLVLSLVSVTISTRILRPAGYGLVTIVALIGSLIFTTTSAWTSTAVSRFGREELETSGQVRTVTWARVALTVPLLALASGLLAALAITHSLPRDLGWSLVGLAVLLGVFQITADHVVFLMEAVGRMRMSAIGILSNQAVLVGCFAIIYATQVAATPTGVLIAMVASSALLTCWFARLMWRIGIWPPAFSRSMTRRIAVFSLPMIAFTGSQYVVNAVDLVVVRAFGSTTDVGVYAVAYRGYSVLQSLALASGPVLTPLFISLQLAGREKVLRRYAERLVPLGLFIGATLLGVAAPLARPVLPVMFGRAFAGAVDPAIVLLAATLLMFVAQLYGSIIVLHKRTVTIAMANTAAAVINVVGDVVLIGGLHTGIVGAAAATTAATACICIWYAASARRLVGSERLPNPTFLAPLIVGVASALALPQWPAVLVGIIGTLITAGVVLRTQRPVAREDLDLLERLDLPGPIKRRVLRIASRA
jgi:O-antigen/teichoic acid export membrane protein